MIVTVIGVGLIGGSIALTLKETGFAEKVIGVDLSKQNLSLAKELGLIDESAPIKKAVKSSNLIIIAIPVNAATKLLPDVLNLIKDQTVIDVGSTKSAIINAVSEHPKRNRFVATHPIWGTEYSGPKAAIKNAFKDKITVLCNVEQSDKNSVRLVKQMYENLGMKILYMEANSHDVHAAYVSHISHITSFALALSVLEKEKEEEKISQLAGSGFESTVRLAKSNPDMWIPIFEQNRSNILDVLNEQIYQLKQIKKLLEMEEYEVFYKLIKQANEIKRIIK